MWVAPAVAKAAIDTGVARRELDMDAYLDMLSARQGKGAQIMHLLELKARRIPALVRGGFDWVDARDVSLGMEAAARVGRSGERYILAGEHRTLMQLARLACSVTKVPPPRFATPVWMARVAVPFATIASAISGKPMKFTRDSLRAITNQPQISHEKAARELGYRPRPLEETIADTYRWFAENNLS